ncbi:MAG: hypothetical protein AAF789_11385 [Bacteroidota bacterium]
MEKHYLSRVNDVLSLRYFFLAFLIVPLLGISQTFLRPGDVAIVAFAQDPDEISFVVLRDIEAGTEIKFTDRGWLFPEYEWTTAPQSREGVRMWTAGVGGITAGTVITLGMNPTYALTGTNTRVLGTFDWIANETVIAYQGPEESPRFIAAINATELNGSWPSSIGSQDFDSELPRIFPGENLGNRTTALAFDAEHGYYSGSTSGFASKEDLLRAIHDPANWTITRTDDRTDFDPTDTAPASFTFPNAVTTWMGQPFGWSDGEPTDFINAELDADYNTADEGFFECLGLKVNDGVTFRVNGDLEDGMTNDFVTISDNLENDGTIIIENQNSLFLFGTCFDRGVTIRMNTTFGEDDLRYSVVGSPLFGQSTDNLGSIVYSYDESLPFGSDGLQRFIPITTSTTMDPGVGYFSAGTGSLEFSDGFLNQQGVEINLSYTSNGDPDNAGFNLVANPYMARMYYSSLMAYNGPEGSDAIESAIYIWDDGGSEDGQRTNSDYITVTEMGDTGGANRADDWTGSFAPLQGFFVKARRSGEVLEFNPHQIRFSGTYSNETFFRLEEEDEKSNVLISLRSDEMQSNCLIGFDKEATDEYDVRFDARSIRTDFSIYSLLDQKSLAIQGFPELTSQVQIPLGFTSSSAMQHELIFEIDRLLENANILLIDNYVGSTKDMKDGPYTFSSNAGSFDDRFAVIISPYVITGLEDVFSQSTDLQIGDQPAALEINAPLEGSVSIFNLQGKSLGSKAVAKDGRIVFSVEGDQVLIVKYQAHGQTKSYTIYKK